MNGRLLTVALSVALCWSIAPSRAAAAEPHGAPRALQYQRFKFLKYSVEYPKPDIPQPLARIDTGAYFLQHLLTTDPSCVSDAFRHMVDSLRIH